MAADNPFGYAGYMYDKEIGMYYLIARYYNPDHGVFLSVDPDPGDADDPVTQNGYTYANNNPMMFMDPDGNRGIKFLLQLIKAEQERRKKQKTKPKPTPKPTPTPKPKDEVHKNSHSTKAPAIGYSLRDKKLMRY
ncbi:RHS repeat-associated core domain-containing protein [Bacillus tropicus]|uniref:RHS repeat-associated core domain-containing protein n=1 Tax=Bacillus tropicus TaxID=2026188 RepID=UPI003D1AF452